MLDPPNLYKENSLNPQRLIHLANHLIETRYRGRKCQLSRYETTTGLQELSPGASGTSVITRDAVLNSEPTINEIIMEPLKMNVKIQVLSQKIYIRQYHRNYRILVCR